MTSKIVLQAFLNNGGTITTLNGLVGKISMGAAVSDIMLVNGKPDHSYQKNDGRVIYQVWIHSRWREIEDDQIFWYKRAKYGVRIIFAVK